MARQGSYNGLMKVIYISIYLLRVKLRHILPRFSTIVPYI